MCKITDALYELEKLELKFLSEQKEAKWEKNCELDMPINEWCEVSQKIAQKKVMFMPLVNDNDKIVEGIIYFPKFSKIKEHFHDAIKEELCVIKGSLNYKVFENDNGEIGKVIKEGVLGPYDKVFIDFNQYHYLLTSDEHTYSYVKYIRNG